MIEVKRVEVRDRATMIPAIALGIRGGGDDPLMNRAGFGADFTCVLLIHLANGICHHDVYDWPSNPRTMQQTHRWLQEHWEEHQDGTVVDVEFILGETAKQKESEVA